MSTEIDITGLSVEETLDHAKRAFALKKYNQAAELYSVALERQTDKFGQDAPELADLYLLYGKALLENGIAQSSVLGKEQTEDAARDEGGASGSGSAFLSFSGDAEEDEPVDLFAEALKAPEEGEDGEEGEEEDADAEPEDDFNAAWEVLELARKIYDKGKDGDDDIKLKLADTYMTLGDVSLETEKFDQAITDYEAGLALKLALLPFSSRQIAEAHYRLSLVLDMSSGRLQEAIAHASKAHASIEGRLTELRDGLAGAPEEPPAEEERADAKGKGKAKALVRDAIGSMSRGQREEEIKELEELRTDLALKIEELSMIPNQEQPEGAGGSMSAPALAAQALDKELNGAAAPALNIPVPGQVNDLTGMVKKKKKAPAANGSPAPKRKADDEGASPTDKKAKLDDAP